MNGWFSRAAIDRIAECAMLPLDASVPAADRNAAYLLHKYAEVKPQHGLADRLFPDPLQLMLWGPGHDIAFEFYCFASLLELAVATGYVDLAAWDKTAALGEIAEIFLAREAESGKPADPTLVQALVARLHEKRHRVAVLATAEFNAFGSLLNLERAIRNDVHAREFVEKTPAGEWRDDLAFLITPEQFAEQLADELRDERRPGTIRGGLAAMRSFEMLGDILGRLEKNKALAEAFVRGTRWAQQAENVQRRIAIWAERMAEWPPGADDREGEHAWERIKGTFLAIERRVEKLEPKAATPVTIGPPVEETIESLMAEGRIGGALRLARYDAERRGIWLEHAAEKPQVPEHAQNFLDACKRLAELGDPQSAASFLAPRIERLREHLHALHFKDALAIMERARTEKRLPGAMPEAQGWGGSAMGKAGFVPASNLPPGMMIPPVPKSKYFSAGSGQ